MIKSSQSSEEMPSTLQSEQKVHLVYKVHSGRGTLLSLNHLYSNTWENKVQVSEILEVFPLTDLI